MKKSFSQKFQKDKFLGIHLFVEVEPKKYLLYVEEDTGLAALPFLESTVSSDLSLRLVGYLYDLGLSLNSYRELAKNTFLEYGFIDKTPGVAHQSQCLVVSADKTDRTIPMRNGAKPLVVSLNEIQEYFRGSVPIAAIVDAGLARLMSEERMQSYYHFFPKVTSAPDYLLGFYEAAVLPQFGISGTAIDWGERIKIGPDEFGCDFKIGEQEYVLIFEDYQGLGQDPVYIENECGLRKEQYEFVPPVSATNIAPSYAGFRMPAPYIYVEGVTGTFTLLRIYSEEEQKSDEPKETYRRSTGGVVSIDESQDYGSKFLPSKGFMPYGRTSYLIARFVGKVRRALSH